MTPQSDSSLSDNISKSGLKMEKSIYEQTMENLRRVSRGSHCFYFCVNPREHCKKRCYLRKRNAKNPSEEREHVQANV